MPLNVKGSLADSLTWCLDASVISRNTKLQRQSTQSVIIFDWNLTMQKITGQLTLDNGKLTFDNGNWDWGQKNDIGQGKKDIGH